MFDNNNSDFKNKYDKDYLINLDNDLESLKMDISDHDVYGNANLKEVPEINYRKLIDSLSKLKIDGAKEDAEVIDELTENINNDKKDEIKVIREHESKLDEINSTIKKTENIYENNSINIDDFLKNNKQQEIIDDLKIPDINLNNENDNYQEKVYIPNLSIDLLNKIETEDEQINLKIPLLMDDKNKIINNHNKLNQLQ